jgi:voltage-gated potassium channel
MNLRTLWSVTKRIGFHKVLAGFAAWFFISAFLIMLVEPGISGYGDAVWYCFVACTSIGFGDLVATTFAGRLLTILLTVYEIVIVAMFSGVVVSYYLEVVHRRENEVITNFLDKMEHLTELSREELQEIQDKIRKYKT